MLSDAAAGSPESPPARVCAPLVPTAGYDHAGVQPNWFDARRTLCGRWMTRTQFLEFTASDGFGGEAVMSESQAATIWDKARRDVIEAHSSRQTTMFVEISVRVFPPPAAS